MSFVYAKIFTFAIELRTMTLILMDIKKLLLLTFILLVCPCFVDGQTKRALLVGISEYNEKATEENTWSDIHGANDVNLLAPTLKEQGFKVTKLCNATAKADRIRKELTALAASCKKGDVVYIHFSTHGQPIEDFDNDESEGWDEAIIPYDAKMAYEEGVYEGANHITDDELHQSFQKIRESIGKDGFLCVVIDACHAGSAFRGQEEEDETFVRGTKRGFTPNNKDYRPRIDAMGHFTIEKESDLADVVVLEACRSYQSNYEIRQDGVYYGPLSYYVNKTLTDVALAPSLEWVMQVKQLMGADNRLVRQNMVYETSLE